MDAKKQGMPLWMWFLAMIPVAIFLLGALAALATYAARQYMASAKQQEAQSALIVWGDGIAQCGSRSGALPASTLRVPASLAAVSGKQYQSATGEWNEPAHTCAGFVVTQPQYFQYGWEQHSNEAGILRAVADLDGDGRVDSELTLGVTCGAGSCARGEPLMADKPVRSVASAAAAVAAEQPGPLLLGFFGLCLLGNLIGGIWLLVVAFRHSVGWGLASTFLPYAAFVFVLKFWEQAKRPFLLSACSLGALLAGAVIAGGAKAAGAGSDAATPPAVLVPKAGTGYTLPPPPAHVPVPELTGSATDLSTVMGKARKLANEWEPDAALLGIEATLVAGVVQTQQGAVAKLTFGPSVFTSIKQKSGLYVVTYDQQGLKGEPYKGRPGKSLPEPMCAPEAVYNKVAGGAQQSVELSYRLDSRQRPTWQARLAAEEGAPPRLFDPQDCRVLGQLVAPAGR